MVFDQQLQIVGFFLRKSFFQNNTIFHIFKLKQILLFG
jgi:hypothetical protein